MNNSSRDLPWVGRRGRRPRHNSSVGAAETRNDNYGHGFHPYRLMTHAELVRATEPQPDIQPEVDARERFLATVFLRRCVTWCARVGRYDRVPGAATLYRRLA